MSVHMTTNDVDAVDFRITGRLARVATKVFGRKPRSTAPTFKLWVAPEDVVIDDAPVDNVNARLRDNFTSQVASDVVGEAHAATTGVFRHTLKAARWIGHKIVSFGIRVRDLVVGTAKAVVDGAVDISQWIGKLALNLFMLVRNTLVGVVTLAFGLVVDLLVLAGMTIMAALLGIFSAITAFALAVLFTFRGKARTAEFLDDSAIDLTPAV